MSATHKVILRCDVPTDPMANSGPDVLHTCVRILPVEARTERQARKIASAPQHRWRHVPGIGDVCPLHPDLQLAESRIVVGGGWR